MRRLDTFSEPSPVAKSNPVPALKPLRIPIGSPANVVVQFRLLVVQGTEMVPVVTSLNVHALAGRAEPVELQLAVACSPARA